MLGTADLRLLRAMVDIVMKHLLDLTSHFVPQLSHVSVVETKPWSNTLTLLHTLASSPVSPDGRTLPPTAITQHVQLHFLPHVYLSSFLLAWAPSFPPSAFQATRALVKDRLVGSASKVVMLRTLWRTIGFADGKSGIDSTGWNRSWPRYAKIAASRMVDMVIVSPGGVRALIYGMIGEEAVLAKRPRKFQTPAVSD